MVKSAAIPAGGSRLKHPVEVAFSGTVRMTPSYPLLTNEPGAWRRNVLDAAQFFFPCGPEQIYLEVLRELIGPVSEWYS